MFRLVQYIAWHEMTCIYRVNPSLRIPSELSLRSISLMFSNKSRDAIQPYVLGIHDNGARLVIGWSPRVIARYAPPERGTEWMHVASIHSTVENRRLVLPGRADVCPQE